LPTCANAGTDQVVHLVNAGTGIWTIGRGGSDTFNLGNGRTGLTAFRLQPGEAASINSDGANPGVWTRVAGRLDIEELQIVIKSPTAVTTVIRRYCRKAGRLVNVRGLSASGTNTLNVKLNGSNITFDPGSVTSLGFTSAGQSFDAISGNVHNIGDKYEITITSAAGDLDLNFVFENY
jgi:hypothetical protein